MNNNNNNNNDSTEVSLTSQQHHNDNNNSMVKEVPIPPSLPPTDIIYMTYEGNFQTECRSTILQIIPSCEEGGDSCGSSNNVPITTNDTNNDHQLSKQQKQQELSIILDRTVMHAQGGGQPTDIGQMVVVLSDSKVSNDTTDTAYIPSSTTTKIQIHKVLLDRSTGLIKHYGTIVRDPSNNIDDDSNNNHNNNDDSNVVVDDGDYYDNYNNIVNIGTMVHVRIDTKQRQILSECHTAGHVVDAAMVRCGYQFRPSKGYHFLDSPYVEYIGSFIDGNNNKTKNNQQQQQDEIVQKLQLAFQQLIDENIDTKIELLSITEAEQRCNTTTTTNDGGEKFFDLDAYCTNINENNVVRIVTVSGYACPCGGTHVRNTGILQTNLWNITGIKSKKGLIRIKYGRNVIL
jgi:Ser-tRNA(Ala) deacylase AlaX